MNAYKNSVNLTAELKSLIFQIIENYFAEQFKQYGNAQMDLDQFIEDMKSGYKLTQNVYPNENFIVLGGNKFDISGANIEQWESNLNQIESYQSLGGSVAIVYEKIDKNKPAYVLQKIYEESRYYALIIIK